MDTATVPQNATTCAALLQPDNRSYEKRHTAVGYVRVSTSLQAEDGLTRRRRYAIGRRMEDPISPGLLDAGDGLNPTRALILQGHRTRLPIHIGTRDIALWIKDHEPDESLPSDSLIRRKLPASNPPLSVLAPTLAVTYICSNASPTCQN